MFDNAPPEHPLTVRPSAGARQGPEEERIALRCTRKELQLLDSFVVDGEFRSRSELMRAALREFLRSRAASVATAPQPPRPGDLIEVPVRLRAAEVETLRDYATLVGNGRALGDLLADLVRQGERKLEVLELVERARRSIRQDEVARERLDELARSGAGLQRRGVVGR